MEIIAFENFIESTIRKHKEIKNFVWGDAFEQIQEVMLAKASPFVVFESPDVVLDSNRHTGQRIGYTTEMIVLERVQVDDKAKKKLSIQSTLQLSRELLLKFQELYQDNTFEDFKTTSNLTQVQFDNNVGWRCTLEFWFDTPHQINENKWLP